MQGAYGQPGGGCQLNRAARWIHLTCAINASDAHGPQFADVEAPVPVRIGRDTGFVTNLELARRMTEQVRGHGCRTRSPTYRRVDLPPPGKHCNHPANATFVQVAVPPDSEQSAGVP